MRWRSRCYPSALDWCNASLDVGHIGPECRQRDGIVGKAGEERPIRGDEFHVQVARRDDEFAIVGGPSRGPGQRQYVMRGDVMFASEQQLLGGVLHGRQ